METVLSAMRKGSVEETAIVHVGEDGVYLMEAGGPPPGTGCAGRGIITAFEKIKELPGCTKLREVIAHNQDLDYGNIQRSFDVAQIVEQIHKRQIKPVAQTVQRFCVLEANVFNRGQGV